MVIQNAGGRGVDPTELHLADMVFLLGHSPETRQRTIADELHGVGVAAGIFGELILGKNLVVQRGDLVSFGNWPRRVDNVVEGALEAIRAFPRQPSVREVLDRLRHGAYRAVAARLEAAEMVTGQTQKTGLFRRQRPVLLPKQHLPIAPLLKLNNAINHGTATPLVSMLAGIVSTLGIHRMFDLREDDLMRIAALNTTTATLALLKATAALTAEVKMPRAM